MQPIVLGITLTLTITAIFSDVISLKPLLGPSAETRKLRSQVCLKVDFACHSWKNVYIILRPDHFEPFASQFSGVWEMLEKVNPPPYTLQEWQYYSPLFDDAASNVRRELDGLLAAHSDVLPIELRTLIEETKLQIETEQSAYKSVPWIISNIKKDDNFFYMRFHEMARVLAKLSREADRLRKENDLNS